MVMLFSSCVAQPARLGSAEPLGAADMVSEQELKKGLQDTLSTQEPDAASGYAKGDSSSASSQASAWPQTREEFRSELETVMHQSMQICLGKALDHYTAIVREELNTARHRESLLHRRCPVAQPFQPSPPVVTGLPAPPHDDPKALDASLWTANAEQDEDKCRQVKIMPADAALRDLTSPQQEQCHAFAPVPGVRNLQRFLPPSRAQSIVQEQEAENTSPEPKFCPSSPACTTTSENHQPSDESAQQRLAEKALIFENGVSKVVQNGDNLASKGDSSRSRTVSIISDGIHGDDSVPCTAMQDANADGFENAESPTNREGSKGKAGLFNRSGAIATLVKKRKKVQKNAIMGGAVDVRTATFSMQEKLQKSIFREPYDVTKFYKNQGLWQFIGRNWWFETTTLFVIASNTLWIWIDTDYNKAETLIEAEFIFQFVENLFCLYFLLEWVIRFMSFRDTRDCFRDFWFNFDSCLIMSMVAETWLMGMLIMMLNVSSPGSDNKGFLGNVTMLRMARLLRLSRMCRMARLLRACPELSILIKGMVASMRSVLTTLFLLLIIIFIFALLFAQMTVGSEVGDERFKTVPMAMNTLWLYGVLSLDFAEDLADALSKVHILLACCYYLFVLLAAFTVMNMLIGVLCEVVSAVASTEKEGQLTSYAKHKLNQLMKKIDKNGNGQISKHEFDLILECSEACRFLHELGVDVASLPDFKDILFESGPSDPDAIKDPEEEDIELSISDFVDLLMQLRGTKSATVKDIVELRKLIHQVHKQTSEISRKSMMVGDGLNGSQ